VSSFLLLPRFLSYLLCAVLLAAKIADLNDAVSANATNLRPAAVATPQPAQKQPSFFDALMNGQKKLSKKEKGKHKEKAKVAALPVGHALMSASQPLSSKKRQHQLTVSDLSSAGSSRSGGYCGTGVSGRQVRRDTAAIREFSFKQTADNPARMPRRYSLALGRLSSGLPSARRDDMQSALCPLYRASCSLLVRENTTSSRKGGKKVTSDFL
jgi:hypothetical protein